MVSPKKKDFWPRINILEGFFFNLSFNVSSSKIGHDFSDKVVQKISVEKNVFNKSTTLALFVKLSFIDRLFFLNFFF